MRELAGYQRRYLQKAAHKLKPVVMIGKNGITDAVMKSTDGALEIHELVKVRFIEYKEEKKELAVKLARGTEAVLVRITGNVALLYRAARDPEKRNIDLPNRR